MDKMATFGGMVLVAAVIFSLISAGVWYLFQITYKYVLVFLIGLFA